MGSGSSTSVALNRDKNLVKNREHLRAVRKFSTQAYGRCSHAEAIVFLLSNDTGLKHFSNFVVDERETGYLDLYLELNGGYTKNNTSVLYFQHLLRRIVEEYINADSHSYIRVPSHLIRDLEEIISADFDKPITHIMDVIEQLSEEMVELMAREQFPRFLMSKFFHNWQANDRRSTIANGKASVDANLKDRNGAKTSSVHECSMVEDSSHIDSILVNNTALANILRDGSWLSALISAVELLPISFLLCQAIKIEDGLPLFPVLYANKYVEKSFGFQRKALIGKPYDALLRCAETKKEGGGGGGDGAAELEAMTQQYQAASVVLTHVNSTGVPFKNLVATKPIFDPAGTCVYVIYLMFTLSSCSCSSSSSCCETEVSSSPWGSNDTATSVVATTLPHNTKVSTSGAHQISAASIPAGQGKIRFIVPEDRHTEDCANFEKLLRILPKYVNLVTDAVIPPAPAAAAPGLLEGALGKMLPLRTLDKGKADHVHGQRHRQAPVLSIREAQLSKGPNGRLGAAPPM